MFREEAEDMEDCVDIPKTYIPIGTIEIQSSIRHMSSAF